MNYSTEQEEFWAGGFGDEYVERKGEALVAANMAFFSRILNSTRGVSSILELGANIGLNLQAIRLLLPRADISAVEINNKAVIELEKIDRLQVHHESILEFSPRRTYDLVFTKGVLIHINPKRLSGVYELLYSVSNRYVLIFEYYNPSPIEITYVAIRNDSSRGILRVN